MILNVDFALKLSNIHHYYFLYVTNESLKMSKRYYILSLTTIHCRSLPLKELPIHHMVLETDLKLFLKMFQQSRNKIENLS